MRRRMLWMPGLITGGLAVLGLTIDSRAMLQSWLAVSLTWGAIPLGAVAVLMTHDLTGGRWGAVSQPVWRALAATMPLFALSMLPLLLGLETLFLWTLPESFLPEVVTKKLLYLNEPFFVGRTLFYLLVWLGLAWSQGAWSRSGRDPLYSAPGLILWVLTITFFGFDWLMSLEPKFYSDVFGLMLCMSAAGSSMAAGILFLKGEGHDESSIDARRDIANLWLAVLLGWAFMAFSQYIIIWSGNLPDEIGWYQHRSTPVWRGVSVLSFGLFCLMPFLILLSGAAKSSRRWLVVAATACLVGHVLQMLWLVLPAFGRWQGIQYWLLPALLASTGATYAGYAYLRWTAALAHKEEGKHA